MGSGEKIRASGLSLWVRQLLPAPSLTTQLAPCGNVWIRITQCVKAYRAVPELLANYRQTTLSKVPEEVYQPLEKRLRPGSIRSVLT